MATSQAAYAAEKAVGHDGSAILQQDVANYQGELGDSGEKMKALVWQGKGTVEVGRADLTSFFENGDYINIRM